MIPTGRAFFKMSGSGNDFVIVDCRENAPGDLATPQRIRQMCRRGTGVGADGVVFLERSTSAAVKLVYLNADGSRADLCGNATLCTTRLARELGIAPPHDFDIETDAGAVRARIAADGRPEIDLQPVTEIKEVVELGLETGERRAGFAEVGVPHVIVLTDDVETIDVVARGRPIRQNSMFSRGANVNFVSRRAGGWRMRTYERGVEAETLACGSGSVASAILLTAWGQSDDSDGVALETRSGRTLRVRLRAVAGGWLPSLSGDDEVVYQVTL